MFIFISFYVVNQYHTKSAFLGFFSIKGYLELSKEPFASYIEPQ